MELPLTGILAVGGVLAAGVAVLVGTVLARWRFPVPPLDRRLGCVDGLRGLLAVSVLVHHFVIWVQVTRLGGSWSPPSVNVFNQLGAGAVALFFTITGTVFYPRVLQGFRACSWPAILVTRVCRIVPLIAVSVAVITAVIALRTGHGPDWAYPRAAAKWVLALSEPDLLGYPDSGRVNAYVLWSLYYEWQFYLFVLPACALAMDLIRGQVPSWTLPAALLAGSLAWRLLGLPFTLPTFLPLFAVGMLAYECQRAERVARVLRSGPAGFAALAGLGAATVLTPVATGAALPAYALVILVVACGNRMGGLLRWPGLLVLGECSYGIYLLHGIGLDVLFVDGGDVARSVPQAWLAVLLPGIAAIVVGVSAAGFLGVERPMMRVGGRIARWWTGTRARTAGARIETAS